MTPEDNWYRDNFHSVVIPCIEKFVDYKKLIEKKLRNFELPNQFPNFGVAGNILSKTNHEFIELVINYFDKVKTTQLITYGSDCPISDCLEQILVIGMSEPQDIEIIIGT